MLFKLIALTLPLLAVLTQGKIVVKKDADRKLVVFNNPVTKGVTIVLTSRTKTGNGTWDSSRQWIYIRQSPCPGVSMKRVQGSFSLDEPLNAADAESGAGDWIATSHSFVIPNLLLWNDTNSTVGIQKEDVQFTFPLCGQSTAFNADWNALDTTLQETSDQNTGSLVKTITKCAELSYVMDLGGIRNDVGTLCFSFSIANGTYTDANGVKRNPGQIKIDKSFTPSALIVSGFGSLKPGFMGVFTASNDAGQLQLSSSSSQTESSNEVQVSADAEITFSGGTAAYLNYNKTVACEKEGAAATSVNVYLTSYDLGTAETSFNVTLKSGSIAVTGQTTKRVLLFGMDKEIGQCDSFEWDPETGYSDTHDASNTAVRAVISSSLAVLVFVMTLWVRRM